MNWLNERKIIYYIKIPLKLLIIQIHDYLKNFRGCFSQIFNKILTQLLKMKNNINYYENE